MKNAMKTVIPFMLVFMLMHSSAAQENIVKLRPAGVWVQTLKKIDAGGFGSSKRNIADYDLGISFEHVLNDDLSLAGDFDFVFTGVTLFLFRPSVNYYLMDSAPNELYVGGYFEVGGGNIGYGAHIGLGPKAGYQYLLLDDQLALLAELGLGFGMFTDAALDGSGPGAGVNLYFTVGAGYAF